MDQKRIKSESNQIEDFEFFPCFQDFLDFFVQEFTIDSKIGITHLENCYDAFNTYQEPSTIFFFQQIGHQNHSLDLLISRF